MLILRQSDPRASMRRVYFTAVDTSALQTRLQSSDMSSFVVYLVKNGGSPVLNSAVPVQVDATNAKGVFYVPLAAADLDTPGQITVVVTNTGGTKTMEKRELQVMVNGAYYGTVVSGTLSASAFTSDRTESQTNHWTNALVTFLTGTLAGQVGKVSTYSVGSPSTLTMATGFTFTAAPTAGDIFEILNR